jgi:hypothetical protein
MANAQGRTEDETLSVLLRAQEALSALLKRVDGSIASAARELSTTGLEGAGALGVLHLLCKSNPLAVDCVTVNREGKILLVQPSDYRGNEGKEIGSQEQMRKLRETVSPVMSELFRSVEGYTAIDVEHPVLSKSGDFTGSVSILFKPEALLPAVVEPVVGMVPVEVWVMQTDGRILYSGRPKERGTALFEDPLYKPYPQLIALGSTIVKEKAGSGVYESAEEDTKRPIEKRTLWTTVGLYGTEWRVVASSVVKPRAPKGADALLREDQDVLIKKEVQTAVSMLQAIYEQYQEGKLTLDQAKGLGADLLRKLRYGDAQDGYFWADTTEGVNIVLYGRKDVEGTNRYDAQEQGVYYIREFIARGKEPGGGYTSYRFPKMGGKEPFPKRSYTLLFKKFGWVVGTGYYLDDVERSITARAKELTK